MVDEKVIARRVRQRSETIKNLGKDIKVEENDKEPIEEIASFKKAHVVYSVRRMGDMIKTASDNRDSAVINAVHTGYREIKGNKIKVLVKKVMRKLLRIFFGWYILPIHERQTDYNHSVTASLESLVHVCAEQRKLLAELNRRTELMAKEMLQKDETVKQLSDQLVKNEIKYNLVCQKLDALERTGGAELDANLSEEQKKYFSYIREKLNISYDPALIENDVIDYFEFENKFRGSEELIKDRQKGYVKYLETDYSDGYVLELGFGRGEILDLLKENGIKAIGVDNYRPFVEHCTQKGHTVVQGDALTYLSFCDDESLNGIVLSQVAEHLNTDYLYQLIRTGYKKLRKGCSFIIETPCSETLSTYVDFYNDATHIKPVSVSTLNYVFESNGYSEVVRLANDYSVHPYSEDMKTFVIDKCQNEDEKAFYSRINSIMFGARDYTLVARK